MADHSSSDIEQNFSEERHNEPLTLNEAVEKAKTWLTSTLQGEKVINLGLEEVDHGGGKWYITLGFSRPWDASKNAITMLSGDIVMRRTYKIVTIDERSGEVLSMKNWDKN